MGTALEYESSMCLLKIYLEENGSRRLIAEDIASIIKKNGEIRIRNLNFEEKKLKNVEIVEIDALNSILLLRRKAAT